MKGVLFCQLFFYRLFVYLMLIWLLYLLLKVDFCQIIAPGQEQFRASPFFLTVMCIIEQLQSQVIAWHLA